MWKNSDCQYSETILSLYKSNASGSKISTKARVSQFEEVNKALYQWYLLCCSKNIFPGGPQLTENGKQIAERLGISDFKGSNGWLGKWKARYNIKRLTVCGESGDVHGVTVDSWKERLCKKDILNMDESGVFWRALPNSGFGQKGKECKGGKKSKHRLTVAFFVSASGVKEKPIVIWKSENPRCLKRFDKSALPVNYFSQKKAWMSGEIMETILTKLNNRLSNAGCHPESLQTKFSQIIIFASEHNFEAAAA